RELRALGLVPDIIVARVDEPLDEDLRRKIAMFCDVRPDCVVENHTASCLYDVPLMLHREGLDRVACRALRLRTEEPDLAAWTDMVHSIHTVHRVVRVAIIGKYIRLHDAYLSASEALTHAGYALGTSIEILWVDSEEITRENAGGILSGCAGILIPGSLGEQGLDGMIAAAEVARVRDIPYLGMCMGLRAAVLEYARAFTPDVGDLFVEGSVRLGAHPIHIREGTALHRIYGETDAMERHRLRHEFHNAGRETMERAGLIFSATSRDGALVEAVELPDKRFFVGVQYHPEFKSRPNRAHPLFVRFIEAALREMERQD
ncbi:MAG: gamma-glutamyl-gamma-aminobutyrate hydrolase family protein, partial [Clostridia bacterium]|nr:gamma-glutamyl-gamma-aminobutyrate hydrolase family protein [Clostridia bacterium]